MGHRWTVWDPETDLTMRFPINPQEGALPQRERNISTIPVSAPDGRPLIFEGADNPQEFPCTGVILTKDHWDFFNDWYDSHRQMKVTDDLGNVWWLYMKKFAPKRKNRHSHPWFAEYEATFIVVNWDVP